MPENYSVAAQQTGSAARIVWKNRAVFLHCAYAVVSVMFLSMAVVTGVYADYKVPPVSELPVTPVHVHSDKVHRRLQEWHRFIERTMQYSEAAKLDAVNRYVNQMRFMVDLRLWKQVDYWATPLQLLAVGAGDCEDFAIAKFFALKTLKVPVDRLRVTYVWQHKEGSGSPQPHMVLTYKAAPETEPLVLDNLTGDIKPLSQRKELQVVYAFNTEKFWLPGESKLDVEAGSPAQLPQWRNLSQRLKRDLALLGLQ